MDSQISVSRRDLIQSTTVGVALSVTGCSEIRESVPTTDDTSTRNDTDGTQSEPGIDPSDGVVTQVGPSEPEAQQLQQEILQQAEAEGWSEERAREELNDRFRERVQESIDAFETAMAENDDITIEGIVPEVGVILLNGSDTALITALQHEEFASLMPGTRFEDAQQAVQDSHTNTPPETNPDNETG